MPLARCHRGWMGHACGVHASGCVQGVCICAPAVCISVLCAQYRCCLCPPMGATLSSPPGQPRGRIPTDPFSPPAGCKLSCHTKCQSKVRPAPRGMSHFAWEGLWRSGGVLGSISHSCHLHVCLMRILRWLIRGCAPVGHRTQGAGSVRKGSPWLAAVSEPLSPFLCLLEAGEPPMQCCWGCMHRAEAFCAALLGQCPGRGSSGQASSQLTHTACYCRVSREGMRGEGAWHSEKTASHPPEAPHI